MPYIFLNFSNRKKKIVEIPDGVGPEVGFSFRIYPVKHSDDSD